MRMAIASKAQQTTSERDTYIHTILFDSTGHWHVGKNSVFVLNVRYRSENIINI